MSSKQTFKVIPFIRGYHAYMDIWLPSVKDEHDLKREPSNKKDTNVVAVVRESLHKSEENRLGPGQRNKGEFRSRPISAFVYIFALSQSECVKRFIT
jgi:hypothetical protein